MTALFSNDALSTINGAISDSATTIVLTTDANLFPAPTGDEYAYLTLFDFDGNKEIVKLTARVGTSCTVTRGEEGTTAAAWPDGSRIELRVTAAGMNSKADKDATDAANAVALIKTAQSLTDPEKLQTHDNLGLGINYNRWKTIDVYNPSAVAALDITGLGDYSDLLFDGVLIPSASATLRFYVGADNGATWLSGANNYKHSYVGAINGVAGQDVYDASYGGITVNTSLLASPRSIKMGFNSWNSVAEKHAIIDEFGLTSTSVLSQYTTRCRLTLGTAVALNAIQIYPSTGTISGEIYLEGRT